MATLKDGQNLSSILCEVCLEKLSKSLSLECLKFAISKLLPQQVPEPEIEMIEPIDNSQYTWRHLISGFLKIEEKKLFLQSFFQFKKKTKFLLIFQFSIKVLGTQLNEPEIKTNNFKIVSKLNFFCKTFGNLMKIFKNLMHSKRYKLYWMHILDDWKNVLKFYLLIELCRPQMTSRNFWQWSHLLATS